MEMDKHRTAECLSTNGVRAEIEKTVSDYFARYAQNLPNHVRDERERYVIDCCLKRATETEEQYQRANADTNAFVLGVLFSQCISEETRFVQPRWETSSHTPSTRLTTARRIIPASMSI